MPILGCQPSGNTEIGVGRALTACTRSPVHSGILISFLIKFLFGKTHCATNRRSASLLASFSHLLGLVLRVAETLTSTTVVDVTVAIEVVTGEALSA
jgi:hypothetical protein